MADPFAVSVDVKLDNAAIEQVLAAKIAESALGDRFKKAVEEELKKLGQTWGDNPYQKIIQEETAKLVREIIQEKFKPQLEATITAKVTEHLASHAAEKIIDGIISSAFDVLLNPRKSGGY